MSDNPTVVKLRQALTLLAKDKEAGLKLFSEVASEIEALENKVIDPPDPPRFYEPRYEANTNQHGSLVLPTEEGAGIVWELTTRADTIEETLRQMIVAQKTAIGLGFIPADKYVDQRRQDRGVPQMSGPVSMSKPTTYTQDTNGHPSAPATAIVAAPQSDQKPDLIWKLRIPGKSKYPVPIYEAIEEVKPALLSEGVDLSTLTTPDGKLREYQLSGWAAYYEAGEKGYPKKVIKLVKVS